MDPKTQHELEQLCEAPPPADYLALLKCYPAELRQSFRADDGQDFEGTVADVELLAESAEILKINQEVRMGTILDPEGREFRWPDQLLVIGETGDGDYYCVDTDGEHPGVLQFRHHAVEFEYIAESLSDFVDMLIESFVNRGDSDDDEPTDDDDFDDDSDEPDSE